MYFTLSTSQFEPAMFLMLNGHMWMVASTLEREDLARTKDVREW